MAPKVLKKSCERCGKTFLTYEKDLIYCNTDCEGKHKYEKHFKLKGPSKTPYSCTFCGDEIRKGRKNGNSFCNHHCREGHAKKLRDAKSDKTDKKPKHALPPHTLTKIHEKKRVYDDKHAYWYVRRGGSY